MRVGAPAVPIGLYASPARLTQVIHQTAAQASTPTGAPVTAAPPVQGGLRQRPIGVHLVDVRV